MTQNLKYKEKTKIMRYCVTIIHKPGKEFVIANTLSRNPLKTVNKEDLEEENSMYVGQVLSQVVPDP